MNKLALHFLFIAALLSGWEWFINPEPSPIPAIMRGTGEALLIHAVCLLLLLFTTHRPK